MSIKKIFLLISPIAACSAFATSAPIMVNQAPMFNGFYVGAAGGADTFSYKIKEYSDNTLNATAKNGTQLGAMGQLNAGYQYTFANNWLVGGEVFGNLTNFTSKNSNNTAEAGADINITTKLTDKCDYGFDAQGGYVWNKNLFYGLLGMTFSNLKLQQNDTITEGPAVIPLNQSITKFAAGYTVGFGVQQALTDHLRLREQAAYTLYPSTTYHYDADMPVNKISASSLQRFNFLLGLAYQF